MKKHSLMKTTKLQKMMYAMFVTLMCSSIVGGITAAAVTNWRVTKAAYVQTVYRDAYRKILWEGLIGLGRLADSFNNAIDTLLGMNLYSLAGSQFNITSTIYPIAGAVLGFAITLVGVIIILKAHNGNHLERVSTMIGSIILLAALPAVISAATDIKNSGTVWAKSSFELDGGYEYGSDGTVTPQSLGNTLIISNLYDMGKSIDNDQLKRVSKKKTKAEAVDINDVLDREQYHEKPRANNSVVYVPDSIKAAQNSYDDLSLDDKINLIDRCYAVSNHPGASYSKSMNVGSLKKIWEAHEDDYIEPASLLQGNSSNGRYIAKSGGRTSTHERSKGVYCKIKRISNTDSWEPIRQVFKTNSVNEITVYLNKSDLEEPEIKWPEDGSWTIRDYQLALKRYYQRQIQWGTTWTKGDDLGWSEAEQYEMRYDVDNYQVQLCWQLSQELRNARTLSHLPSEAKSYLTSTWLSNIDGANSLEEAIAALESLEIEHNGLKYSVMEWFNLDQNIDIVNKLDDEDMFKSKAWVALEDYNPEEYSATDWFEKLVIFIKHGNLDYGTEHLYAYHVEWFDAYLMLIVTDLCLLFAGFKIATLMFDVLFAEVVAPIAVASDMSNSGRAKQAISNIIACNICFVAVIYIVRLFFAVLIAMNGSPTKYSIIVKLFITLAGAKFVIDGPDLIVKLTGMDAGVKSGLSTIMGVRSAAQMAGGAARTAKAAGGLASKAAGGVAGGVAGAVSGAKNGKGIGKLGSAALGAASGASTGAKAGGAFSGAGAGSAAGKAVGEAGGVSKVAAAMGNSSAGQAFKSGAANQARTNDSYAGSSGSQSANDSSANGGSSNSPISMTGKDGSDGKDGHDGIKGSDGKDADNNQNDNKNETANAPSVGGGSVSGGSSSASSGGGSIGGGGSVSGGSSSASSGGGSIGGGGSVSGGSSSVSSGGGSIGGGGSVSGGSSSASSGGGSIGGGGSVSGGSSSVSSGGTYTPASSSGVSSASGSYSSYNNDLSSSNSSPTISVPTSDWEILKDNYDNRIGDTTNWRGGKDPNPLRPDRRK